MSAGSPLTFLAKFGSDCELGKQSQPPRPSSEGRGGSACTGKDNRVTQPPSPPRRAGAVGHVVGARRAQAGGRIAGKAYAPIAPRLAGHGNRRWPDRDYSKVEPRSLREAYVWWQDICRDGRRASR